MKDLYREETNHDVYADYCCERPAGSYADEYVKWLEDKLSKLSQHDVSGSLPLADLEKRLDEALAKETPENLDKWLKGKRQ